MSENTTEVIAGGVVLAAAVGFLIYAGQAAGFSAGAAGSAGYDLTASFRSVDGISVGTDVRLAGVKIGRVSQMDLNTQTYRADVTVAIDGGVEIPEDTAIAISSEGLLGGNYVELVPGGSPFMLEPGSEIEDTQGAISLIGLLSKFVSGREE
ncbi:outer membrane lipid asymmetry maintenance protein MlaD [Alphaproteobacteria bacterium KMM 3653]|uniref:Outer membrane lipid asymmetry maintenance protein MlaD n=1 Tax=Harenicola maris TaxID=2841044 RepID=A0AAP2CKH1_9RHOB|nr:outer membrane lipid asymmetry maintenance protein MlaD [Harenicola maris]